MAADALHWAEDGFSTFKLKLGAGDDVGQVRAVRDAVGPEAQIRIDANGVWPLEAAKQKLAALEPFDIELVEQPVATLDEAAELALTTSIPIAADESVESRSDAEQAIAMNACGLAGLKLSKVGGPEEAIEIAEVIPSIYPAHSMGRWESQRRRKSPRRSARGRTVAWGLLTDSPPNAFSPQRLPRLDAS